MGILSRLLGNKSSSKDQGTLREYSKRDKQAVGQKAMRIAEVINESLKMANQTKNTETKQLRLNVANEKLGEIKELKKQFPFLTLTALEDVERDINRLARELEQSDDKQTNKNGRDDVIPIPNELEDITSGFSFEVALKLTTPLKVLEHQHETHPGPKSTLPKYCGPEYGTWMPVAKPWSELAQNEQIKEKLRKAERNVPSGSVWSDIGELPGDGGHYLAFLKDFRKIIELYKDPEMKRSEVQLLRDKNSDYRQFMEAHEATGEDWADDYLGYGTWLGIKDLSTKVAKTLYLAGFKTRDMLRNAEDKDLMKIKGIGTVTVRKIRHFSTSD